MICLLLNSYFDNVNLYLTKYNVLFYNVPKVASSTIWSICAEIECGYKTNKSNKVRSIILPSIKSSEINLYTDVIKIAFVRNPYDRLVSCYRNKIEKEDSNFLDLNGLSAETSFSQFVDYICDTPDSNADRHFRSQYTFIYNHNAELIADHIGRFESFYDDFKNLSRLYELPSVEIPHWNKESESHYSSFYTDSTVEKVKIRYAIDLSMFGYEFNKPLDPSRKDDWKKDLSPELQIEILKSKSQKLLRIVKHKEKYDDLPNGVQGFIIRKYKEYFTDYFE